MKIRQCTKCKRLLPDEMFAPNTKQCRFCRRDYDWFYRYGITPDDYLEMYENQGGRCAICGKETEEYLCVDHDNKTHAVRGLLCQKCNKGLGSFEDSVEYLKKAMEYLKG